MLALDLARFIPLIIIISYAAYKDIKTKHVPNKLWNYMLYGATLTAFESFYYLNKTTITYEVISIIATIAVAYTLFYIKAWGGADAKALTTIAVSAPMFPTWTLFSKIPALNFYPIAVFYIACLAVLVYTFTHKTKIPLKERKIQFLPFILVGLIVCVLLW
jgi:archaeal preflagellin peptidase FlaK